MINAEEFVALYRKGFKEPLNDGNAKSLRFLMAHVDQEAQFEAEWCKALVIALARKSFGHEFEMAVDQTWLADVAQLCRDVQLLQVMVKEAKR